MRLALVLAVLLAGCASPSTGPASPTSPPLGQGGAHVALHDTGWKGGEPSLGIRKDGSLFVIALDDVLRSADGGATWKSVYRSVVQGDPACVTCTEDPMLAVDTATDRVYVSHLSLETQCTRLFWSDDGTAWDANQAACLEPGGNDYQKLAAGVPGPDSDPLAGVAYKSVLYLCFNKISPPFPTSMVSPVIAVSTNCAVSYDGGRTFPQEQDVSGAPRDVTGTAPLGACGGGAGRPAVSAKGVVAVPLANGCRSGGLAVSTDSGRSWVQRDAAKGLGMHGYPEVAWTRDGSALYMSGVDENGALVLSRSTDLGKTWQGPWNATPPGVHVSVMPTLQAGADGRVALGAIMTTDNASDPDSAPNATRWNLWLISSDDATGAAPPTFRFVEATNDSDPVQIGPICTGGAKCTGARNLDDFIGSAIAPDGTFHVVFADGCAKGCDGNPSATAKDSRSAEDTVADLLGWSLTG